MTWDQTSRALTIKCNGTSYECSENSGDMLINKIQEIRRAQGFERFDVFDGTGVLVTPPQVRAGEFEGDLTLVRFNKAA
jgi:hypothetical protein